MTAAQKFTTEPILDVDASNHLTCWIYVPILVRQPHESEAEFALRSGRDWGLIKRFAIKDMPPECACQEDLIRRYAENLQLHVLRGVAIAGGLIVETNPQQHAVLRAYAKAIHANCSDNSPTVINTATCSLEPQARPAVKWPKLISRATPAVTTKLPEATVVEIPNP